MPKVTVQIIKVAFSPKVGFRITFHARLSRIPGTGMKISSNYELILSRKTSSIRPVGPLQGAFRLFSECKDPDSLDRFGRLKFEAARIIDSIVGDIFEKKILSSQFVTFGGKKASSSSISQGEDGEQGENDETTDETENGKPRARKSESRANSDRGKVRAPRYPHEIGVVRALIRFHETAGNERSDAFKRRGGSDLPALRVFLRSGLITHELDYLAALRVAKERFPTLAAPLDLPAGLIGREWCRPKVPKCKDCPIRDVCKKRGV